MSRKGALRRAAKQTAKYAGGVGCIVGCSAVHAQVTMYGIVDSAIEYGRFDRGVPALTRLQSGDIQASRLGLRGVEDLGAGLQARFQLEMGISIDTGNGGGNTLWNRGSTVGLASKDYGSIDLGKMYVPIYWSYVATDVSTYGLANLSSTMSLQHTAALGKTGTGGFYDNAIRYRIPTLGGLNAEIGYSFGNERVDSQRQDGRNYGASVQYQSGPVRVAAGYNQFRYYATPSATVASRQTTWLSGGAYDAGFVVIGANFIHTARTDNNWQGNTWLLNAKIPVGASDINIGTARLVETGGKTSQAFHLGYVYHLSKRTDLYGYGAYIANNSKGNRGFAVFAPNYAFVTPGYNPMAFALGLRHAF